MGVLKTPTANPTPESYPESPIPRNYLKGHGT